MRHQLVSAIEDKAHAATRRQLAIEEALPLTEREEVLVLVGIRAGIKASLAVITEGGTE